jgi:hypothetical protein
MDEITLFKAIQPAPPDDDEAIRRADARLAAALAEDAGRASLAGDLWLLPGGLGRTVALLFPASPYRLASRRRAVRVAIINVAVLGAGAGVLLIRQAGTPSWATVWAEDGSVFLPRAMLHPWSSLFREQAGYLQLVPQLIADVVARFPPGFAAAGFAVGGALVASCCAIFVWHASSGHVRRPGLRALLAGSVLLLPTAVIEIANSGVDAPWYLMYALFWALLWRPRSRPGLAVAGIIAFAAMASNILNLLYLPLVAARLLALPRTKEQAVTSGWLAGILCQIPAVLHSHGPHRWGSVPAVFHFYGQHVLLAFAAGWRLALRLQSAVGVPVGIALGASVVVVVVAWAAWRGDARVRVFTVTALTMGMILTMVPALIRFWVASAASTDLWVPGSRYTASAILLIEATAIVGVDARLRRPGLRPGPGGRGATILLLVAGLSIGWSTSFRYPNLRSASLPWSQTYRSRP